jgi:tetratricopeptide (TPR) repeat protein
MRLLFFSRGFFVIRRLSEAEINAADTFCPKGEYSAALDAYDALLARTDDVNQRLYLLFQIVRNSSLLDRQDMVRAALTQLDAMPMPEFSRVIVSLDRAFAEIELRRPANALTLLDATLETKIFDAAEYRMHLFRLYWLKGRALDWLNRHSEALEALEHAEGIFPSDREMCDETELSLVNSVMPSLLITKASCFLTLDQLQASFDAALRVREFDSPDWSILALQYMAESRAWQGRTQDALKLYAELIPQLPCSLVDEARVRKGMANCMLRLEGSHSSALTN